MDSVMDGPRVRSTRSLPLLALAITAIWGVNFVVIKVGTDGVPPLLLAALRFTLVSVPAVFFVRAPRAAWQLVAAYGLFLGVGEFGLLFCAIKLGAPTGLSSLILQAQAFFTAWLARVVLKEPFGIHSALGMALAACGLGVIGWQGNQPSAWGGHFALALTMLLGAAFMWGVANIIAKRIGAVGTLSMLVWSSLASPLPLLALSWWFEGPDAIMYALVHLSWRSGLAIAYLVVLSTLFGYGAWNHLIVQHGAARVAPFSMLVPIFGVTAGAVLLGESFHTHHALAALLVIAGLTLHVFGARFFPPRG
ncbi:MAG: EamA family transporter [Polyangiales bacterium]